MGLTKGAKRTAEFMAEHREKALYNTISRVKRKEDHEKKRRDYVPHILLDLC
jgi:hypothetical protein